MRVLALLLMLLCGTGTAQTSAPVAVALVEVDTAAIVEAVGEDGVAVLSGADASAAELAAQVRRALDANIDLKVIVLPEGVLDGDAERVVQDLQRQLAGTVLLLTPVGAAAESDSVGAAMLSSALAAARAHPPDAVAATAAFVGALDSEPFPWTLVWIAGGGIVLLILIASVIRALRHRRTPPAA